ncbi:hypothetical protein CEXT_272781 [Caerostris extrusa]|uniref:Uncharacterized protein n=1 Tax=Caerostris extrusa TaxID=172846 RepID=A0AAV4M9B7_CAEEX|nr:hypothetical protein CEXT_272781 [Caerostris extrusa]
MHLFIATEICRGSTSARKRENRNEQPGAGFSSACGRKRAKRGMPCEGALLSQNFGGPRRDWERKSENRPNRLLNIIFSSFFA